VFSRLKFSAYCRQSRNAPRWNSGSKSSNRVQLSPQGMPHSLRHLSRRATLWISRSCSSSLFSFSSRFWRHAGHSLGLTSRGGWKKEKTVTSPWNLPPQVRHSHSWTFVSCFGLFSAEDDCPPAVSESLERISRMGLGSPPRS